MKVQRLIAVFAVLLIGSSVVADEKSTSTDDGGIAPQPLDTALEEFAERSGLQVIYLADVAKGKQSPGAEPDLSDQATLDQLLASTDLQYEFLNDKTVTLQTVTDGARGDSDSKNSIPTPVLMAQNTAQAMNAESPLNDDERAGIITGRVTDARTGVNLKGALVTIEETRQSTSTNDLGAFRFPSVSAGTVTLTVSYLGYASQSAVVNVQGRSVSQDFMLRGGSELEEIVVFGERSARAQSLNQERTAPNAITVISSDQLGNFNGTTISEALRRAPGIAFVPDESTGDGANIVIRGLEPDLNQVTLNGAPLIDGTGLGRAPDLSAILTGSIESVTINRTLLPSQDSNGAGALVEIETFSPLDRAARFASINLEYGEKGSDFGDEFLAIGSVSGKFGEAENVGISASASYRERSTKRINYSVTSLTPEFLPAGVENPQLLDPRTPFPFTDGVNVYPRGVGSNQGETEDETLFLSVTGEAEVLEGTNLRLDMSYSERVTTTHNALTSFFTQSGTREAPVESLGGELRFVSFAEDPFLGTPLEPFLGSGIIGGVNRSTSLNPDVEDSTLSLSLRGDTQHDLWTVEYGASYSSSEESRPTSFDFALGQQLDTVGFFGLTAIPPELLSDEARQNTIDGSIVSIFAPVRPGNDSFLLPLLSQQGVSFFNDTDELALANLTENSAQAGEGETLDFNLSGRRDFAPDWLSYVEVGVNYRESSFENSGSLLTGDAEYGVADGLSISDFGLAFGPGFLIDVGAQSDLDSVTRESAERFLSSVDQLVEGGQLVLLGPAVPSDDLSRQTSEDTLVAYLEASMEFGPVEVIGGFRYEELEISSRSFSRPRVFDVNNQFIPEITDEFAGFITDSATQSAFLPRVLINYTWYENTFVRFGYFQTVSRPRLEDVTDRQFVTLRQDPSRSPTGDRPVLEVRQGNPDLNPAKTDNFDLSFERYFADAGVIKIAAFYKVINDPLQDTFLSGDLEVLPESLILPDIPEFNDLIGQPVFVALNQPVNGDKDAEIFGFELTVETQLNFLPEAFDGLGVYANYAYTDSSIERRFPSSLEPDGFIEIDDIPFDGSPENSGTFGFTYTNYRFDGSLLYSYQDRRLDSFNRNFAHDFSEEIDSLDLAINYLFDLRGLDARLFLRATDLLSDADDRYLARTVGGRDGVPKYFTGASYFGGRTIRVGFGTSF